MTICARRLVNPEDKFGRVFRNLLERPFVERMDQNEEVFARYMNDIPFPGGGEHMDGVCPASIRFTARIASVNLIDAGHPYIIHGRASP
jgi:hypothetical protein